MTETTAAVIEGFTGTVMTEGHPDYDAARTVFNAMIDRRPAVIARCRSASDVAAAIRHARAHGLEVSVYGGGHGVAGPGGGRGGAGGGARGREAAGGRPPRAPGGP